jgi:hypothetical protein
MRAVRVQDETGTSVTESMLLTWLILVFVAAALQIFVMNESLYRSLTATHAKMMTDGFSHNHWQYDAGSWDNNCASDYHSWNTYNTDEHAKEIWNYQDFPEIRVQVLGMFQWWGGSPTIDIKSNYPGRPPEPDKGCPDYPCKKIKMGAGTAGPTDEGGPFWSRPVYFNGHIRLYCQAFHAISDDLQHLSDIFNDLTH